MTDQEAKECFEKAHFLHEQIDMQQDIDNICYVLSQNPVDMFQVRTQIETVNRKHRENVIIFNMIFPPQGSPVSLDSASNDNLISDLIWKLKYLQAKQIGKTFEELCKTMHTTQEEQNGGLK